MFESNIDSFQQKGKDKTLPKRGFQETKFQREKIKMKRRKVRFHTKKKNHNKNQITIRKVSERGG